MTKKFSNIFKIHGRINLNSKHKIFYPTNFFLFLSDRMIPNLITTNNLTNYWWAKRRKSGTLFPPFVAFCPTDIDWKQNYKKFPNRVPMEQICGKEEQLHSSQWFAQTLSNNFKMHKIKSKR